MTDAEREPLTEARVFLERVALIDSCHPRPPDRDKTLLGDAIAIIRKQAAELTALRENVEALLQGLADKDRAIQIQQDESARDLATIRETVEKLTAAEEHCTALGLEIKALRGEITAAEARAVRLTEAIETSIEYAFDQERRSALIDMIELLRAALAATREDGK